MAGIERVRALHIGLHRALVRLEQTVAHSERAGLIELDDLLHDGFSVGSADARSNGAEPAQDRLGRGAGSASRALALELVTDHVGVQVKESDLFELVAFGVLEQPPQ